MKKNFFQIYYDLFKKIKVWFKNRRAKYRKKQVSNIQIANAYQDSTSNSNQTQSKYMSQVSPSLSIDIAKINSASPASSTSSYSKNSKLLSSPTNNSKHHQNHSQLNLNQQQQQLDFMSTSSSPSSASSSFLSKKIRKAKTNLSNSKNSQLIKTIKNEEYCSNSDDENDSN